jgi:hypothetical protein
MFRCDENRFARPPDHGLGRGAEDGAVSEMKMLTPLGQEDPVAPFASLGDDRLVDDPRHLQRFGMNPGRLALPAEILKDRVGLGLKAALDGREEFLVGGDAHGARDIGEDRSPQQADVHDMDSRQLGAQFLRQADSVGDGGFPEIGTVGGNEDVVNHEASIDNRHQNRGPAGRIPFRKIRAC